MGEKISSLGGSQYYFNTTCSYHSDALETLGWELTVCNALYPTDTPIRRILVRDGSYGHLLHDYLRNFIPLETIEKVIEIGGGYGFLMKDLVERSRRMRPCMLDISPTLIKKQQEMLQGYDATFRLEDALETDLDVFRQYDFAILNENLGDFPTLVNLDRNIFTRGELNDSVLKKVLRFFNMYNLERPSDEWFNFNIGAMEIIENLCSAGVNYIFVGEHSCEATTPKKLLPYIRLKSTGNPKRITLMGHDEYTIKFSYIQRVATHLGYKTVRGPFADYIVPQLTGELMTILGSRGLYSDKAEIICQFVEDLYEYEYLILMKERSPEVCRS